jgi:1-deoxy-D-xylulose-5-phosphate synthase
MLQIVPGIRIAAPRDAERLREELEEASPSTTRPP